ncbi:hypothetical protein [Nostoc sp.]
MSSDIAGARYPEQAIDNALAAQLAEIGAIGRNVTDHFDNTPIMWNW